MPSSSAAARPACSARRAPGSVGRSVVVLERNRDVGRKILISGGGRCNFTNLHCRPEHFLSEQPAFRAVGAGALHAGGFHRAGRAPRHRLSREDAGAVVLRRLGAADRRSAAERMPRRRRASVDSRGCDVGSVSPRRASCVDTSRGDSRRPRWSSPPAASRFRRSARPISAIASRAQFGVDVVAPRPALVPLLFDDGDRRRWRDLAGIAINCAVSRYRHSGAFRGQSPMARELSDV